MSTPLTVNGITYAYPSAGEAPGWGEAATDWAEAITTAVAGSAVQGDIAPTLFTVANNQVAAANVTGLIVSASTTKAGIIEYSISRTTSTNTFVETGEMKLIYKPNTTSWEFSRVSIGDAGVTFSVTSSGQVQYTSTNISGASYVGKLRYRARALTL